MISKSAEQIEAQVIIIIQDAFRKGKVTRDEGFVLLQRLVRQIEHEIVLASKSSADVRFSASPKTTL
jgi:hypothetical protein